MFGRLRALIIKELLAILREPKSRIVIIVPPILQTLVFGYAATYDLNHVRYAVYNQDSGQAARDLLAGFEGSGTFERVADIRSDEEIAPLIDEKKVLMVLRIHPQFTRDLLSGRGGSVQIILDGRNSNTAVIATNYARGIVTEFSRRWAREHGGNGPPAEIITRAWFNPNLESRWYIVPGVIALMTLVVTVVITSLSVAREREQGTFDQLLVTPFRPAEILIGKAIPGILIGVVEVSMLLLVVVFWFKVPLRGNLLTLYAGLGCFLVSTIGIGLLISSLSATMQQALLGGFLFLVPAVTLSGFTTPIANMPPFMQKLTLLNPLRHFIDIVRGVFLKGLPMDMLANHFWPMLLIGLATLTLAGFTFRRRLS